MVVYSDSTQRGGAEQALGYLIGGLDERIAVTVVGVEPAVVAWIASHRPDASKVLVPAVSNKLRLGAILAHIRAIRRLRPDVLHASLNSPWSCQYGILAGLLTQGTQVVVVENALVPSSQPVQRLIKRLISRGVAAHIAVGECSAREVERLIGMAAGSIRTIRNGVPDLASPSEDAPLAPGDAPLAPGDAPLAPEHLPLDLAGTPGDVPLGPEPRPTEADELEVVIGTVSRIGPHKGIELIVRALADLPHTTAVIVGDGPMLAEIRALSSSLGVADRMRTPGFDPNPRRWLTAFDIFVLPTRTETALPLAVVEGMLAGLPVVASDLGSIAESFLDGETGLLVPRDDLNALTGALRLLAEDPLLRERMGADARAFALEHFGIAAMVAAYEALYREVASRADLDLRRA